MTVNAKRWTFYFFFFASSIRFQDTRRASGPDTCMYLAFLPYPVPTRNDLRVWTSPSASLDGAYNMVSDG